MIVYNNIKGEYEEVEIRGSKSVEDMEGQWRRFDEKMEEINHPVRTDCEMLFWWSVLVYVLFLIF